MNTEVKRANRENDLLQKEIKKTVDQLSQPESYKSVFHKTYNHLGMLFIERLSEIIDILKSVIFPGYFGESEVTTDNMKYHLGSNIDRLSRLLREQIRRGFCFACSKEGVKACQDCQLRTEEVTRKFIGKLPEIRNLLATDVQAAYYGDPAAKNPAETIFCYPSIIALLHHRIAHALLNLEIPIIPRIISEMAHSKTGVDIHPGAQIDKYCFIDHGTGVVIGETCEIGEDVRLYQGVTLGAKSFPLNDNGDPIKGIPRHPILEDGVIIYSGATILGRITIGKNAVIGGNVWLTHDVDSGETVMKD